MRRTNALLFATTAKTHAGQFGDCDKRYQISTIRGISCLRGSGVVRDSMRALCERVPALYSRNIGLVHPILYKRPSMMYLAALTSLALPLALALSTPPQNFVNTAIARTVELGGATTQIITQYNVKSLADGPGDYYLALVGEGDVEPAYWEVSVGGKAVQGAISDE